MTWPDWLTKNVKPKPSTWHFDTSEAAEFDALVYSASKGSLYVKDSNDEDGIIHELLYVGAGVTQSKGPLPFGIGGTFSTPDMYSEGVGPIMIAPGRKTLGVKDFAGLGMIVSGSFSGGKGMGWSLVFFGFPPLTRAAGRIKGELYGVPGAGFTALAVYFVTDP